ncbi:MAG: stage III sporulation protein AF [Eubacteriales bacterium]
MMELLRQWLLGMIGTTILVAIADGLMPSGGVKQVGKIVCGLMLLVMIVKPLLTLSEEALVAISEPWYHGSEEEEMEKYYNDQMKSIIEGKIASYIMDKATESDCSAEVVCELSEDGVFVPIQVILGGTWEIESLSHMMEELGVEEMIYREEVSVE